MFRKIGALVFLLGMYSSSAAFAVEGCTLNRVIGEASILRDGQKIAAKEQDTLGKGDGLVTGTDCTVDMSVNDLAGCRVLANTEMEIAGWKPANMSMNVRSGNVILNLKKLPVGSNFKIETPTAVASVRGTQFWGRVESASTENPVTTFAVREGSVEVLDKSSSQTFALEKGKALDLPKTGDKAPIVRDALPQEMQALEQAAAISTSTGGSSPLPPQ